MTTTCARCSTPTECTVRGCAYPESIAAADLFGQSLTKYKVDGRGAFPVDMLRVDNSWPCTGHDSARILNSYGNDAKQAITLCSLRAPNFRAWLASGWQITEINGVFL
jgi:hypothetical protein